MPSDTPETTPDYTETWHRRMMEVVWTDSGKMILKHDLKNGGRINHTFEIDPLKAKSMKDHKDA